jgi:hypothetical protein
LPQKYSLEVKFYWLLFLISLVWYLVGNVSWQREEDDDESGIEGVSV